MVTGNTLELKYNTNLKTYNTKVTWGRCLWSNFAVGICCLDSVFALFETKIYSKLFRFLATTAEKQVIWGPELRLWICILNTRDSYINQVLSVTRDICNSFDLQISWYTQAVKVIAVFPSILEAVDKGWHDSWMYDYNNILFLEMLSWTNCWKTKINFEWPSFTLKKCWFWSTQNLHS